MILPTFPTVETIAGKYPDSASSGRETMAVEHLLRNAIFKDCDVRVASGRLTRPILWLRISIDPLRWKWKVILSYPAKGDHINVAEMNAILTSIRWRVRSATNVCRRCVHFSDSQVCISVLVRGRSSSYQLNKTLHRINCLLLASSLSLAFAYIRTDINPADRPSRWRKPERE